MGQSRCREKFMFLQAILRNAFVCSSSWGRPLAEFGIPPYRTSVKGWVGAGWVGDCTLGVGFLGLTRISDASGFYRGSPMLDVHGTCIVLAV